MRCTSKDNSLTFLKKKGYINDNRVLNIDTESFNLLNKKLTDYAKTHYKYDLDTPFYTIETIERKAVAGHNYHRDNIYKIHIAVPNETAFDRLDQIRTDKNLDNELDAPLDYFEDYAEPQDQLVPDYERYIIYKNNLVRRLENRLSRIANDKKKYSTNTDKLKELTALENELKLRIDGEESLNIKGLKDDIIELTKAPPIEQINYYAEADMQRLDKLSKSENEEDLHEARDIISFYEALGTFDVNRVHPFFLVDDMFDMSGNLVLPKETIETLDKLKDRAKAYNNIIVQKEKSTIVNNVNNNSKIQQTFQGKEFEYDELFYKGEGLKDIPWADMFLMDVTNGVFSQNGLIPQVMMNTIQNSFEKNLVYAKSVENRMNTIQADVEKELGKLGYKINIPGISGVSYDLFRATDENGQFKDSITQRYSSKFMEERNKMFYEFDQAATKARDTEDPVARQKIFKDAYAKRKNWYKKNTIILDIRKIPEIVNDPQFADFKEYFQEDNGHSDKLKETLGKEGQGYKEEIDKQIKLLRDYITMQEVFTENLISEYAVSDVSMLPREALDKIETWEKRNNPFETVQSYYSDTPIQKGKMILNPTMSYSYSIPRRNKVKLKFDQDTLAAQEQKEESGYYDPRFKTIEENETLKEFHDLLSEVTQKIYDTMPVESREKFSAYSIPALKKNLMEILFDKNTPLFQRLSAAARYIYDKIKSMFGMNAEDNFSYANVDPITGKPEYKVNDAFIKGNKQAINNRHLLEMQRLKKALGMTASASIKKYDKFDLTNNPEALAILAEALGVSPTASAVQKRLPNENIKELEVSRVMKAAITDQVVQENSFDLPKILKLYSYLTMEYAARQEALPIVEMMKRHYEQIQDPSVNNVGENIRNSNLNGETRLQGARTNAIKQMESQFLRWLGYYGSKNEFGDTRIKRTATLGLTGNEKIDSLTSKIQTTVTGKILDTDEKIIQSKLPQVQKDLKDIVNSTDPESPDHKRAKSILGRMDKIESGLGKQFSMTAFFDAMFNFIRFKGLGYNVSSSVTNFLEGQISNITIASTGDYFTPENIYRATDIVKGSFLKTVTGGKIATPGAKKTRVLMDRYRILQDASNELQKASSKSAFSKFKNLEPYEITKRTEYLNQAPLMIAVLLDTKIQSKDRVEEKYKLPAEKDDSFDAILEGRKTSITRDLNQYNLEVGDVIRLTKGKEDVAVRITNSQLLSDITFEEWRETSSYDNPELYNELIDKGSYEYFTFEVVSEGQSSNVFDAMDSEGKLKEEFRTEENIKNWEEADGKQYNDFSSHVNKMIVNTHGDYDELRGNYASERITGKALMMFKRWITRQLYQRFAQSGQADIEVGIKDYKGRYKSHTAATGMLHGAIIGFGGLGILGAGPLGLLIGGSAGFLTGKFYGAKSDIGFVKESALATRELLMKTIQTPVNMLTGKNIVKTKKYADTLEEAQVDQRDIRNIKANMADMSFVLASIALLLFTKALLWDDEDDEDDARRMAHNLLANRFMQLSSQSAMYLSPGEMTRTMTDISAIKFLTDVGTTAVAAEQMLEGNDTISSGPNAGESKLYNQFSKTFFPGIAKGSLGFESQMQRQFQQSPFDKWFYGDEKEAQTKTREIRAVYRAQLQKQGVKEEDIASKVNEKYRPKKEGESYVDLIQEYGQ